MGENSSIEWTDHTFNPWIGCTKISPGCDHCYAEGWAKRSGLVKWGEQRRRTSPANWLQPLKWNAEAARTGTRPRVFCASLADVFDNQVPIEWTLGLWDLIDRTPNLTWLLLTKRIGNVSTKAPWPRNAWLGITVVNQEEADRDIPKLLAVPAPVRFLSCEPLLGPIDLSCIPWNPGRDVVDDPSEGFDALRYMSGPHIDWVIVGGESGPRARPFVLGWGKEIVRQCQTARVPVFVKQVGARPVNREGERCPHIRDPKGKVMEEWPQELRVRQFPG